MIGGGVIGSSVAYDLLEDGFSGEITIFEKDKTYTYASTPSSAGGIRQLLGERVRNFDEAKIVRGWAGIYRHNTIDQNAIIGEHPSLTGYFMACGFGGHGMQQAPAVRIALSELIRTGAIGGNAVRHFARKDVSKLAIIGTDVQGLYFVSGYCCMYREKYYRYLSI